MKNFKSLQQIDSAFKYLRWVLLVIIMGCLFLVGFAFYTVSKISMQSKGQIYVMNEDGNVFNAILSSRSDNIDAEAKNHIKMFHKAFFEFDPEMGVIENNKNIWIYLSDESANLVFNKLSEERFFQNAVASNISSRFELEEMILEPDGKKINFKVNGIQNLERSTSLVVRNLDTQGTLRPVKRTDNNPHGFIIEDFFVIDNSDIKVERKR